MSREKALYDCCTGCGLCQSLGKATLVEDNKGYLHPVQGDTTWLKEVCPSGGKQFKEMDATSVWGKSCGVFLGWSNDVDVRNKASSGGIITEVASYLVENNMVDAVVHCCADKVNPTETQVCLSYSREEISQKSGSRYAISHPLSIFAALDNTKRYCFIGKPCDVVALRNFMRVDDKAKEMFPYVLSFFCMGLPSKNAQVQLLNALDINPSECSHLTYRGNGWPGYTIAKDLQGNTSQMDYDSSWGKILGRDLMYACKVCSDGIGELADISCGDAWYLSENGKPDFSEHEGRNVIFARNEKGLSLLRTLEEKQRIEMILYSNYNKELRLIQKSQYERRVNMRSRIAALKLMHRSAPMMKYKVISMYSKEANLKKQCKEFLGTCKRVIRGKM